MLFGKHKRHHSLSVLPRCNVPAMSLPSDHAVSQLLQYLVRQYEAGGIPMVDVAELKKSCGLEDMEFQQIVNHFQPTRIFQLIGPERLQIDRIVLSYKPRFNPLYIQRRTSVLPGCSPYGATTATFANLRCGGSRPTGACDHVEGSPRVRQPRG